MEHSAIVFQLRSDASGVYDGSASGIQVDPLPGARRPRSGATAAAMALKIARNPRLDHLQAFAIEATVTLDKRNGARASGRQTIASAEAPGVRLEVDGSGKLIGSVRQGNGWVEVDSGRRRVPAGKPANVAFLRAADGTLSLEIDGEPTGSGGTPGELQAVGETGFTVGRGGSGSRGVLRGNVSSLVIRDAPRSARTQRAMTLAGKKLVTRVRAKTGLRAIDVHLMPELISGRLRTVKDIMQGLGVTRLADLGGLQLSGSVALTPGKVILGARSPLGTVTLDWSKLAKSFAQASAGDRGAMLSTVLPNRNSAGLLSNGLNGRRTPARGAGRRSAARAAHLVRFEREAGNPALAHLLTRRDGGWVLEGDGLLERVTAKDPSRWIGTGLDVLDVVPVQTIPTDSAVIMAPLVDLTNSQLVIDPAVSTLYLIADKVICGSNATITWASPAQSTPARADDPDLNGQSWHGVHTPDGSRHGLRGGDGRSGAAGVAGARGRDAPNLEMWVKDLEGMPNLALAGQDGAVGGRGQSGGHGGQGANGRAGRKTCFIACWCSTDAGNGGDGGHGGDGGPGGTGGDGGNGGNILISVLEGTLEDTVVDQTFRIHNKGGRAGSGGDGGERGNRGGGGRSGNGEECTNASDGDDGERGQPGGRGADGRRNGTDGHLTLSVFSLAEWEELLKRPWLAEVNPKDAFPGDTLTLRGSLFLPTDQAFVAGRALPLQINADQSASAVLPLDLDGGLTTVHFRRDDGTESNRYNVGIKPQLDPLPSVPFAPNEVVTLTGRAFVAGATVLLDGNALVAQVANRTSLTFTMPGTGGAGAGGGMATIAVRNPDGMVSNPRTATLPRILEIPFRIPLHGLAFDNFKVGAPSWGTFEDTFGAAEVWHELLDPVFGHPILTGVFYGFYHYFLLGKDNGGLATGFCTSMSALVADKFWKGETDTPTLQEGPMREYLTAVHGRLLSRESLIAFHDQGREGDARVEHTARAIERTFLAGCDRANAPLLFFIPSGAVWDSNYAEKLEDSHCIMPYRFVYPDGHPGPMLSADGSTTIGDLDGVEMYCWDCNHVHTEIPDISAKCRVVFRRSGSGYRFDYFNDTTTKFKSEEGITLGFMTLGDYLLADHDLPFSGPFGLTRFVLDFLMSPAALQVTDENGKRAGSFAGKLVAEIPDSHPCYLLPNAYLLPSGVPLTRRLVGTGAGTYRYNTVNPNGSTLVLENVATAVGDIDELAISADATQVRFSPGNAKTFDLTLSRRVGKQTRAIAISGVGGGPGKEVDVTVSPDLSLLRVGNRSAATSLQVRAFSFNETGRKVRNRDFGATATGAMQDLVVAMSDWKTLDAVVTAVDMAP